MLLSEIDVRNVIMFKYIIYVILLAIKRLSTGQASHKLHYVFANLISDKIITSLYLNKTEFHLPVILNA